jgi:hypothetical protein
MVTERNKFEAHTQNEVHATLCRQTKERKESGMA